MKTITKEELKQMIDNKDEFVLVNVLGKEYFDEQHIKGSINIPIGKDFDEIIQQRAYENKALTEAGLETTSESDIFFTE